MTDLFVIRFTCISGFLFGIGKLADSWQLIVQEKSALDAVLGDDSDSEKERKVEIYLKLIF